MLAAVAAIEWRTTRLRDLVTVAWSLAIVLLLFGEAFLLDGGPATGLAAAATGAVVALLAKPLAESGSGGRPRSSSPPRAEPCSCS